MIDVGCGEKPYKNIWKNSRYLGLDMMGSGADVIGDVLHIPIQSEAADWVVCTEVLEHIFYTEQALAEIYRVMKRGGRLVLSTPLIMGVHEAADYYRFTFQCLKVLLGRQGFLVDEARARGGIFSSIALLMTHIPSQTIKLEGQSPGIIRTVSRARAALTAVGHLALVVQTILLFAALLDRLDKRKDFTLGYVLLCSKQ